MLGHVHTYAEIFFPANIFCGCENFCVHTYSIVSGNFLICSSAQFFCWRESWNEHAHNCFLGAIATARCKQSKFVVYHSTKCLNLLKKSTKSMLIHINGPLMKLNYYWRSWKNTKRSKSPKHRLGILCWQVWRDSRSLQCSLSLARRCCCYWQRLSTQEGWVKEVSFNVKTKSHLKQVQTSCR